MSTSKPIIVSASAAKGGDGSEGRPFKTISEAAKSAQPGDTVLVKAGVYRERVAPPRGGEAGKPITYKGEKLGKVFIRGSDRWNPQWRELGGGMFSAAPDDELFKSDDVYLDSANPFRVPLSSTPDNRQGKPEFERYGKGDATMVFTCGQLIVNGVPWRQLPFRKEVEKRAQSWWFSAESGELFVNFGKLVPGEQQIEIATRRRIFAAHTRGLGHLVVEGFVMEHCGNQYCTNFWNTPIWAQAGALGLRGGHHWVVRNNVIRYANGDALDMGRGGGENQRGATAVGGAPLGEDNLIEGNYILENGAGGIVGAQSTRLVIRGNVILRNNQLGFIGKKRYEHSGIKAHGINDALIERNYVADNPRSEGIWLDNNFPGTRVTRNVVINNGARGIFLEMSDYKWDAALVDHNLALGNQGAQFYVHDASGATVMHNLFANSPADAKYGQGTYIYQVTARTKTGYHSLYNNLLLGHRVMLDINYPSHRSGPQRIDHNVYDTGRDDRTFLVNSYSDRPSPWTPADFLKLVRKEVGPGDPQPIDGGVKVALTLTEWIQFWETHGQANDQHSLAREGAKASYDPETLQLVLTIPFELQRVGAKQDAKVKRDFNGKSIPDDGTAIPGPFQGLKVGESRFVVWEGLPLLARGALPGSGK